MPLKIENYPLTPFKEALGTLWGALLSTSLVCMVTANIPLLALSVCNRCDGWWDLKGFLFAFSCTWILHWILSGIALWGLFALCVHVGCLHSLIYSTRDPFRDLIIVFCNQIVISTFVTWNFYHGGDERIAILIVGGIAFTIGVAAALWRTRLGRVTLRVP